MINRIAKFEKVSYEQFEKDFSKLFSDKTKEDIKAIYDNISLPKRATKGSAGYDFYSPISFELKPNETLNIPTGIRVSIAEGWFLSIYPRSGLGFKYRLQLDNTVGVIDSDYVLSDNEGHIFAKITNDTHNDKKIYIKSGEAFAQGIIQQFFKTDDDNADGIRNGGFGSTTIWYKILALKYKNKRASIGIIWGEWFERK